MNAADGPSSNVQTSRLLKELFEWVGFNDDDTGRLSRELEALDPHFSRVSDLFYQAIDENPDARAVINDDAQRDRLKKTLVSWMRQLISGPHDEAYLERRMKIGRVHVRIGLPQRYVMTAMNVLRTELERLAHEIFPARARPFCISMSKLMDVELAIMLQSYIDERTQDEISTFRNIVFSHLPISAFVVDEDLVVVDASPRHMKILRQPDVVGSPLFDVFTPAFREAADLDAQARRCLESKNAVVLPRIDVVAPHESSEEARAYRVTFIPVSQEFATMMLQIEDLSDAIQSEARRAQEDSLIRLGTMAATVAHEIRNPLAGISAAIQLVRNSFDDDDSRRMPLSRVNEQITRLGDFVGDLLQFSRPIRSQSRRIDLRPVVEAAVAQYPSSAGTHATVDGQGHGIGDPNLLAHILSNLIANAWQAGATEVSIGVDDGTITVSDNGAGIPEESREKIFEPFFTTKTRGTGLGLPTVRKSIEQMGGTIALVSQEVGTRFVIQLLSGPNDERRTDSTV